MLKKGFFAGVESAPGLDKYPPAEIESGYQRNNYPKNINDDTTITTILQSAVDHAMETRYASIKKQDGGEKKMTA